MPEAPEVEVMKQALNTVTDRRVLDVIVVGEHSILKNTNEHSLNFRLRGTLYRHTMRKGKWLVLVFQDPEPNGLRRMLYVHNSMHGRIHLTYPVKEGFIPHKHNRLVISLGNIRNESYKDIAEGLIIYRDQRCWGQIHFFDETEGIPLFIRKLGIDALADRTQTAAEVASLYNKHPRASIGDLLLRQDLLCGIGNIYRSEILHRARISPFCFPGDITTSQWEVFHETCKLVLQEAVEAGGSSIADFENPFGEAGQAQRLHYVYGRTGKMCMSCGRSLVKVELLTKRKIFFCEVCQE